MSDPVGELCSTTKTIRGVGGIHHLKGNINDCYECVNYLRNTRAALQSRADSLERIVRGLVPRWLLEKVVDFGIADTSIYSGQFAPGDFDLLRSLITPEGGE